MSPTWQVWATLDAQATPCHWSLVDTYSSPEEARAEVAALGLIGVTAVMGSNNLDEQ